MHLICDNYSQPFFFFSFHFHFLSLSLSFRSKTERIENSALWEKKYRKIDYSSNSNTIILTFGNLWFFWIRDSRERERRERERDDFQKPTDWSGNLSLLNLKGFRLSLSHSHLKDSPWEKHFHTLSLSISREKEGVRSSVSVSSCLSLLSFEAKVVEAWGNSWVVLQS